ncbi:MAG: Fur family transcriptional regulator [Bacteroidales bacterium]|nr:Fur family transcriptional regulator [Bacteroidales bacterium]
MDSIEHILASRNIKPTAMRELVLKVLMGKISAINLSELENEFDKADRITLYRTLKTFEEKKLIHTIDDGTGSIKYALCKAGCECEPLDLHVHFYCTKCNKTFCLTDISIPDIPLPADFSVESTNMVVKGLCSACRK